MVPPQFQAGTRAMTFELVRLGWPNTVVILALAAVPFMALVLPAGNADAHSGRSSLMPASGVRSTSPASPPSRLGTAIERDCYAAATALERFVFALYLDPPIEMKPQQASVHDSGYALRAHDHGHVIFARQDCRVAEPSAYLADKTASAREVGQPGRVDHGGDNDVAVMERLQRVAVLGIFLHDHPRAALNDRPPETRVPRTTSGVACISCTSPAEAASRSCAVSVAGSGAAWRKRNARSCRLPAIPRAIPDSWRSAR